MVTRLARMDCTLTSGCESDALLMKEQPQEAF
jgi:hypothetical protein